MQTMLVYYCFQVSNQSSYAVALIALRLQRQDSLHLTNPLNRNKFASVLVQMLRNVREIYSNRVSDEVRR
jgi:hypothetical protein